MWATAGISNRCSGAAQVISGAILPPLEGNTILSRPPNGQASASISIARPLSGGLYGRLAFIRAAGISQVLFSQPIYAQSDAPTDLDRRAVKTTN